MKFTATELLLSAYFALASCSEQSRNEVLDSKCETTDYNNTYYYGELINVIKNVTVSECTERCKDDINCVSINYCEDVASKCELLKDNVYPEVINDSSLVAPMENCVFISNVKCIKQQFKRAAKIRTTNTTISPTCGRSIVQARHSLQRIVGGFESKPHSFPWIVSISQRSGHYCGGTLVNVGHNSKSDIIITAAHCLFGVKPNMLSLKLGCTDISQRNCITATAEKFDAHPKFSFDNGTNDIALIKLQKPVAFTGIVMPICLPSPDDGSPVPGSVCVAAGWGSIFENGPGTNRLRQVELPVIDINVCNGPNFYKGQLDSKAMLCAGYAEGLKDSCQGDSGGPLMMKRARDYVLVGVVSFGEGCARPNFPGIYSNVHYYRTWLDQRIKLLSSVTRQIF